MTPEHTDTSHDLFTDRALAYYARHGVQPLLDHRNPHLGSLFTSERALFYLNILYRMLLFKREYELEPLYDDIYNGVAPTQITFDSEYDKNRFRADLDKLGEWELISTRMEKQRLRGYRDNRKQKFRYRLQQDTTQFLEWLEQRHLDDLQSRGNDTRDLLGEMRGTLGELLRLLHHAGAGADEEEMARRVLFQLFKAGDLCEEITAGLADLNSRLLFFLLQRYDIEEVRSLIKEIEGYVQKFLKQTYSLRQEILPLLTRLAKPQNMTRLTHCHQVMERERLQTPNLLQSRRNIQFARIPERLTQFFIEQGGLDSALHRIHTSSIQVWQKLGSHLRELERKNNRLQDLGHRIAELASLPEDTDATDFLTLLLAQPHCTFDPHLWNQTEKAEPPMPKKQLAGKKRFPKTWLKKKDAGDGPVYSMEEARLARLKEWLQTKVIAEEEESALLSAGKFDTEDDFFMVMELAKAGLLTGGKRLGRVGFQLRPETDSHLIALEEQQLLHPEMTISADKK